MPFESQWYVENRVLYICQWGQLSCDDAVGTDQAIAKANQSITLPEGQLVHAIIDSRLIKTHSMSLKELQDAFADLPKPTDGLIATVPGNTVHTFMTQFMSKWQRVISRQFESPEKALAFIQESDQSLKHAPTNALTIYENRQ